MIFNVWTIRLKLRLLTQCSRDRNGICAPLLMTAALCPLLLSGRPAAGAAGFGS